MKKIKIQKFISLCREKGINVSKITREYVYLAELDAPEFLKKIWEEDKKNENDPSFKWRDNVGNTIAHYIRSGDKIHVIQTIRMHTGMGLAECKDYVFKNWEDWKKKI